MELTKTQYKKTEVGLIPEDWEVFSFGDIVDYTKGFAFKSKDYKNDGVRIIRVSDTSFDDIKSENGIHIDSKEAFKYQKWKLDEGDLIFTTVGSKPPMYDSMVGKVIFLRKKFAGSLLNQNAVLIRAKKKSWEKQYILLCNFRRERYLQYIETIYRGNANQASITLKELFEFQLPLPPTLEEQQAIAAALSDVDELITNLEKLIAKKKAIKQGAMQQLLTPPHKGGKRLAGFTGEWEEKRLGEIGEITGAGVDKKIVAGEKPVRLFNYMDIMKRDYVYNHELNHEVTAPYTKTISCNVLDGDIFLTPSSELRTDIGVSALAMEDMEGVVYSYHVYRLRYFIEINKLYGFYLLKTKDFLDQAEKLCEGSGKRYVVSMGKFRNMIIFLPNDVEEQKAISQILYDIDSEIESLESKLVKAKSIKQGMMQELLTGKTRLV
jgi:type I restriction enzyme S subunit